MEIAKRVYTVARKQNDAALMVGACRALALTLLSMGDFERALQHARRGVQIWREGGTPSLVEEVYTPAVLCLSFGAFCEWHLGETVFCRRTMTEALSLSKTLSDTHALAMVLTLAAMLSCIENNPAEVERYASDLIEVSTRHQFAYWLACGAIFRGWARSASGDTAEGISWIEDGIRDYRTTGSVLVVPYWLALKAEALNLADRTSEALEAIKEAEAVAQRTEERCWSAELHRLQGVFLTAMGDDQTEIENSFREAIRIAKEQKSVSLEKRAEATYAEYRRQKASRSGARGFRLPFS
jgi:adenylate cyclase